MSRKSQPKKHRTGRKLKGFTEVYDESRDGPRTKPKQKDETVTYNKSWAEMVGGTPTGQEVHGTSNGDSLINEDGTMTINDPLKNKNLDNAGFEIINEDEDGDNIESDMNTDPEKTDEDKSPTNETPAEECADEPEPASDQPEDNADGKGESDDEEEDESESDEDEDADEAEEEDTDESGEDENGSDSDDEDGPESETEVEVLPDDESDDDEIENDEEAQESNHNPDETPSENSDDEEDDTDEDDDDDATEDKDTDESDEDKVLPTPESDTDTGDQHPVNRIIPIPKTPARRHPVHKKKKSLFKLNIGKWHAKKKKEDSPPKEKVPLKKKWHEWWFGTDEHPVKPFSFKGKLTRWFLKTFCGYVDYITTIYDKPLDEIRCDVELVKKSKVPREAVHVTNMKRTYHLDLDLPIRYFDVTRDYGFTASSAYNYAKDNSITDAMAIDIDNDKPPMDTGKILLIVALVFGAVLAIWFMWPMYAH